jgi:hypothetical protein
MEESSKGAGGQIYGLLCMGFGAGVLAFLAFQRLYLGDQSGWFWALIAAVMSGSALSVARGLRKLLP